MNHAHRLTYLAFVGGLLAATGSAEADEVGGRFIDLTRAGKSAATLVVPADGAPIWDDAIAKIATVAARWGGTSPRVVRLAKNAPLPDGDLVVLATSDTNGSLLATADARSPLARVAFSDDHGFAIDARDLGETKHLLILGKTPRGAFNGAVFCRDFLLDSTLGGVREVDVFVRSASLLRSPQIGVRGTYHLAMYGAATKYTADDWIKVIDRYAEDGMNRVNFWLSGHHPSRKYPQLYNVDVTKGTKLTVDGVARLIRHCHERGIDFYIGGGVFAWVATHYLIQDHPEIAAVKASGLCPSQPYARVGNREHFLEMYETWPEADGFMLEIRDEHGECQCEACQVKLDAYGSKGYGRAEITWLADLAREAWKRNPRLRFCWLIGYAEHKNDVAYYEQIRQMNDPRFSWLDTRVGLDLAGAWTLPGPAGAARPLAFFSRRISHWDPFYRQPVDHILRYAKRIADEGLEGYVPAFEPGFSAASYYSDQIPLPVDALPYSLTGFTYREATWDPGLAPDELRRRIHRRFFSPDAPARLADDLVFLHQFSVDYADLIRSFAGPRLGLTGETIAPRTPAGERERIRAISDPKQREAQAEQLRKSFKDLARAAAHLDRMVEIESIVERATVHATPRTREGLALVREFINDTKTLYRKAVPQREELEGPVP